MANIPETKPVEDSVAKVDNELAVGSDVEFQRKWQKFERIVWVVLGLILVLSFAGVFGRGPLAHARLRAPDGSMDIRYERVQRYGTPSVLTINFPQSSIQNGLVQLWAEESLVDPLGTQRIIPQPLRSVLGGDGISYSFPATATPLSVEFQTQPSGFGPCRLRLRVPGKAMVELHFFVMP